MKEDNLPPRVGIICGGGGLTTETLLLLSHLSLKNFKFIISGGMHFDLGTFNKVCKMYPENNRVVTMENPTLITISTAERIAAMFLSCIEAIGIIFFKKFNILFGIGTYLCVPLFFFAKLKRIDCFYLDSYTRLEDLSTTGKIIYRLRLTDKFYVFHKALHDKYPRAIFAG